MQWAAVGGFVLIYTAQYLSNLPYTLYAKSEFWLDSPGLVFMKLGTVLLLASIAYLWSLRLWAGNWSWVRQLGTTSLLVYWVHIELVYGRWFGYFKERLDVAQCVFFSIVLILCMIGLSVVQTRLKKTRWSEWRTWFNAPPSAIRFKDAARVSASTD
jgi:fucose 4-O-acetylase-like acetyltransferase